MSIIVYYYYYYYGCIVVVDDGVDNDNAFDYVVVLH